jgi:sugar phosphate isomerase/epimerase
MPKSAITVSLVPEAVGGPFVFWNGLEDACIEAARIGLDAVEIFAPDGQTIRELPLSRLLDQYPLEIAAFGTGAGMVKYGLSLSHPDDSHRLRARQFVQSIIEAAAAWKAPVILGSMQGRWTQECDRSRTLSLLRDSLNQLGAFAKDHGIALLYEPLNRYETNLINTLGEAVTLIESLEVPNVRLLADLFHMNIEEADMARALSAAMRYVGHIHLADSNRQAAGLGHTPLEPIAQVLRLAGYEGYLSAEVFPKPDATTAAAMTFRTFQRHFVFT